MTRHSISCEDNFCGAGSKKMATSDLWFVCLAWVHVCLAWLCEVFLRKLISLTNAYEGCGRPTLNFIERFRLGSVRSATEIIEMNAEIAVKLTQMNS